MNEESFVVEKIKTYINNLDFYEDCMNNNAKENCIIENRKMINSRDDMDDALVSFYNNVH